ncbi:MAG: trigger factor [Tannerellaceae bacterium]|jgi:trigger factor|nr:trigger factor [Tannerellaceae bacterium]
MNISLNKQDAVRGVLKIEVIKEDYNERVEASLREYRKKANLPGFRKGMVPMGIINRMYRRHVLGEEVNKLINENLPNYISENQIGMLGEPVISQTEQKELDFDSQDNFEFCFDIALSPEIHLELTEEDKMTYYQLKIDDDMVNEQVKLYQEAYGAYEAKPEDEAAEEEDMIKGRLFELENEAPKAGGLIVEEAILCPKHLKDEEEKRKFIGAKKASILIFNPYKAYAGNEAELSAFLKIEQAGVAEKTGDFGFEIVEITSRKDAELNQAFFDRLFGNGVVTDEETFREKIKLSLSEQYLLHSEAKFKFDLYTYLLKKLGDLALADDILKRSFAMQQELSGKMLDDYYQSVITELKYQLIKSSVVKENEIRIENKDVEAAARKMAKEQCVQYGMLFAPDEALANMANNMMRNQEIRQKAVEQAEENKFLDWMKQHLNLEVKEVPIEEFKKILQAEQPEQPEQ